MTNIQSQPEDEKSTDIRPAHDAESEPRLKDNPEDEDAKLDIALDESFPSSDSPANTQPGKGKDPAPSSGYDEEKEEQRKIRSS
ncbi:MAG: hypothetical protein AB7G25_19060 [Sphingomonadaceae bacterium]